MNFSKIKNYLKKFFFSKFGLDFENLFKKYINKRIGEISIFKLDFQKKKKKVIRTQMNYHFLFIFRFKLSFVNSN